MVKDKNCCWPEKKTLNWIGF